MRNKPNLRGAENSDNCCSGPGLGEKYADQGPKETKPIPPAPAGTGPEGCEAWGPSLDPCPCGLWPSPRPLYKQSQLAGRQKKSGGTPTHSAIAQARLYEEPVVRNKANLGMPGRGRTGRCVVRTLQARQSNPIPASWDTSAAPGKWVGIGGAVR